MQVSIKPATSFTSRMLAWQKELLANMVGPIDIFWLNQFVYNAVPHLLYDGQSNVGYCIITKAKELTELYIDPSAKIDTYQVLNFLIQEDNIDCAIVSTRHPRLLVNFVDQAKAISSLAYLFMDVNPEKKIREKSANFYYASQEDVDWLVTSQGYTEEVIKKDIANQLVLIYAKDSKKIASGRIKLNPIQTDFADIGVWVMPEYRCQGIGKEMILRLKSVCYDRKLVPTCGCDVSNQASKRMLEQAGFLATDRMLRLGYR